MRGAFFLGLFLGLLAGIMVTLMCRIGRQRERLESREGIPHCREVERHPARPKATQRYKNTEA